MKKFFFKQDTDLEPRLRTFFYGVILPCSLYFSFFAFFTYPWLHHFSTDFFVDNGDGFQNAWNIWWINHAVSEHLNPWFTNYLHYPYGTTLLGQTLNPINGFFDVPLLRILTLVQVYNLDVINSFVFSGLTAFWLCRSVSKSYIGGILGGFAFTFSSYHFAHALGHMNLITLQWVPLFILMWWRLLTKSTYLTAVIAATTLTGIVLSDLYYLLFVVLAATIMTLYTVLNGKLLVKDAVFWKSFGLFMVLAFIFAAPLPIAVIYSNLKDPFTGAHNPRDFGADLPSIFIPGGVWYFSSLTRWYWQYNYLGGVEGSVSIGIAPIIAFIIVLFRKKSFPHTAIWLWLAVIFVALSLGPVLHVFGKEYTRIPLPYTFVNKIFPPLELAGVAARMAIMAILACSVLLAVVIYKLPDRPLYRNGIILTIFLTMFLEAWPIQLPLTPITYPNYISFLKKQPAGAVLDAKDNDSYALYYATIYEKPLVFGYISRYPTTVKQKDGLISFAFSTKQYNLLSSQYHIRYVIGKPDNPLQIAVIYKDSESVIYDLTEPQEGLFKQ